MMHIFFVFIINHKNSINIIYYSNLGTLVAKIFVKIFVILRRFHFTFKLFLSSNSLAYVMGDFHRRKLPNFLYFSFGTVLP